MKWFGFAVLATLLVSPVLAAEDVLVRWKAGKGNDATLTLEADQGNDAADEAQLTMGADGVFDISIGGADVLTLGPDGALSVASLTLSGMTAQSTAATSVTNGAIVTVTAYLTVLNGIGGADDTTNTVTVANPGVAGRVAVLVVDSASSNLVNFADSGNLALSGAALLDNNDTLTLISVTPSNWVEAAQTDN